jgi:hypothetical protein
MIWQHIPVEMDLREIAIRHKAERHEKAKAANSPVIPARMYPAALAVSFNAIQHMLRLSSSSMVL